MQLAFFSAACLSLALIAVPGVAAELSPPRPVAARFPLSDVRLLDGPFRRAMELDKAYLLSLDADRLLAGFRKNAGLPEKGKAYGGWEARGLVGQSLGHYLSACSMMFAATGDAKLRDRVAYCVDELAACQATAADGFLGGMPDGQKLFAEMARGDLRIKGGFDLNGGWVPWYNQHKLFAGLRDAYQIAGNEKAKSVLVRLGDWADTVCRGLDDKQMQRMLSVEQGGMNEVLADLSVISGDAKYLALSQRFWHKAVLDPLAAGRDDLTGKHANTNIPKVIGAARLYELTGDPKDRAVAETFWNAVVGTRSFVTGSNSDREHFFPVGVEAGKLGPENGETCNVYNMLKLTGHLAAWADWPELYDFYERALLNHILASIDPTTGMTTYFQSLEPGRFKVYGSPHDSFWCCTGTGMENHARYGEQIYTHADDTLSVNLFLASELTWKTRGLTLTQTTDFPKSDRTTLTLKLEKPTQMKLRVRVPGWAEQGISITGAATAKGDAGSGYVTLDRSWHDGDTINVTMPMSLRLHRATDDPTMAAVSYGPVVLAAELGREAYPAEDNVSVHTVYDNLPVTAVPTIVTDSKELDWLRPVDGQPLHFKTSAAGRPNDVVFSPYYTIHHQRQGVYMRVLTSPQYDAAQKTIAAEQAAARELAARTVDEVTFGEQQPEQDHAVRAEKSNIGHFKNRPFRDAAIGGFFSARVRLKPDAAQVLRLTYWGSDDRRTFDILLDSKVIATQTLSKAHPNQFFDVDYPLPAGDITGKDATTIEFRPHAGSLAGGVFGCRVLTAAK